MESPSALDFLEGFADQSIAPHGVLGVIPAEQGRALIDEHDEDVSSAGLELNALLTQAYSVSQSHIIALKKRLLEEKRIEMLEIERRYLNHVDSLKNEIQQLQQEISNQVTELGDSHQSKEDFNLKAAVALSNGSVKYSHPYSVLKVFQAWREETRSTRRANKLDKVARTFVRKYTLSRAFAAMVLNSHVRKANKRNAEAKFKFDSVTTEMITSYESQLLAMKEDLREAYLSIEAEQLRRQQLEEDLRRLFLKNMTAMNFEALSLFQNSHTMVDTVPVVLEPVVELGSPPRPVRRDLSHSERKGKRASSVPRSPSRTPSNTTPQHHTHHPTHTNTNSSTGAAFTQPSPHQMERQIEQLIASTHTLIPHTPVYANQHNTHYSAHVHATHATHYDTHDIHDVHHNNVHNTLHVPHIRSPPVHTPQPPHPLHNNAHLTLDSPSIRAAKGSFGVPNEAISTPSNPYYHPESPHQLSTVYRENMSSTSKLAHNINNSGRKSSFSGSIGSGVADSPEVHRKQVNTHTTSGGGTSGSVHGTPGSVRRTPNRAAKRTPQSK